MTVWDESWLSKNCAWPYFHGTYSGLKTWDSSSTSTGISCYGTSRNRLGDYYIVIQINYSAGRKTRRCFGQSSHHGQFVRI